MSNYEDMRKMRHMVADVNKCFEGQQVHFIGMDWSGVRDLGTFLNALHTYATPAFTYTTGKVLMSLDLDERFGEVRQIEGLEKQVLGDKVDAYIAFENSAKRGRSAASGPVNIAYGICEHIIPGKDGTKIYLAIVEDEVGISNFVTQRKYRKHIGLKQFMRQNMKNTYRNMSENQMLEYFSDKKPDSLRISSRALRRRITPIETSQELLKVLLRAR